MPFPTTLTEGEIELFDAFRPFGDWLFIFK